MINYVSNLISDLWLVATDQYNVNPLIFVIIYVVTYFPCWWVLFKVVWLIKNKKKEGLLFYVFLEGCLLVAPYLYVLVWGKNLPVWVYILILGLILYSAVGVIRYISGKVKRNK